MRTSLAAAVAATLIGFSTGASAHAWASADIGDTSVTQDGAGANFGITTWQVTLDTGESASRTFDYSVTLHTDGLPATRTWDTSSPFACLPLHEDKCAPDPTGAELVEAYLETYRDGREANPFIEFTAGFADDLVYSSTGTTTISGSFTVTATNIGTGPQTDGLDMFAILWVDSAATTIPEPGGFALGLAGLSTLLALRRRREA